MLLLIVQDFYIAQRDKNILLGLPENIKNIPASECALNHAGFRAAMHPAWCMADCGLE